MGFYLIFYLALAGFCLALFAVFWQTIENDKPKYTDIIGTIPGISIFPRPKDVGKMGSLDLLLELDSNDSAEFAEKRGEIEKLLKGKNMKIA